jgi:NhaP-type Na+/H+ or K+/H+ antiporter
MPSVPSGVVAVAVYGLYGSATSKYDISPKLEESGAFESFWDTFAFVANGIVFFFAGASSLNFLIRHAPIVSFALLFGLSSASCPQLPA